MDEPSGYTGPLEAANRNIVAACLSLAGLGSMALATLSLVMALGDPALASRFDGGSYPSGSGSEVHSAQTEVVAAVVLIVLATVLAGIAVAFRSALVWRLIAGISLLALVGVVPLLWFTFNLAF